MPSPPLDSTQGRMTSGMACHHHLWEAQTVEPRRAWHANITFGQHTRSNDVGRGMTSPPLDNTHGRTTAAMEFHHRLWAAHTVERRSAGHDITTFGQHTWSNDVGCDITLSPLDSTHGRTTSGVACHHSPWTAHSVERLRVWHDIIAVG